MAIENEKDLQALKKRLSELGERAYSQNVYTFTDFLGMSEQDVFWQAAQAMKHVPFSLWGGMEGCERQLVRFGSEELFGYEEPFPINCIKISPLMEKFADNLTHRDFLGALMNLGIERSTLGDIFVMGKTGYLFCLNKITPFIIENLDKIKHTNVKCELLEKIPDVIAGEATEEEHLVASERLDGIVAKLYHISRSESLALFRAKKVFVNGRLNENNSCNLKNGDAVTVRGYGKFVYDGVCRQTQKGKLRIKVQIYR